MGKAGPEHSLSEGPLECRFMEVMAATLTGGFIYIVPRRWENPLPGPLASGAWVLARKGVRKFDPARTVPEIRFVQPPDGLDVRRQPRLDSAREHRAAVSRALAATDDDFMASEIDVLDSKTTALEQA
jgi:hypothetical protein